VGSLSLSLSISLSIYLSLSLSLRFSAVVSETLFVFGSMGGHKKTSLSSAERKQRQREETQRMNEINSLINLAAQVPDPLAVLPEPFRRFHRNGLVMGPGDHVSKLR
jgi:hypothetical protein